MRLQVDHLTILCCCAVLIAVACDGSAGRARATRDQLIGEYETQVDQGIEGLELKNDGTYVQEFRLARKSFRHTGKWEIEHHLFDGTDVVLLDAVISKDDIDTLGKRIGTQNLNVYRHSGRIALALNEAADWYFERKR